MTREEAIKELRKGLDWLNDSKQEAINMAIEALSESSLPEGLDEAAEERAQRAYDDPTAMGYAKRLFFKSGFKAGAEWMFKMKPSEQAVAYVKDTHSADDVSDFQNAMNIAAAKAFDAGVKWVRNCNNPNL